MSRKPRIQRTPERGHLAFFFAGADFQQEEFVDYALVGAERDGVTG
jgi:hypothetical protein